jgi:hypothetical protein
MPTTQQNLWLQQVEVGEDIFPDHQQLMELVPQQQPQEPMQMLEAPEAHPAMEVQPRALMLAVAEPAGNQMAVPMVHQEMMEENPG